jgi:hypothetical protein
MSVQVLHVADCPRTPALLARLRGLDVDVDVRLVDDAAQAEALGMRGSPTVLVDGVDAFPSGGPPSLSCRLYRDESGALVDAPSSAQLRAALLPSTLRGWRAAGTGARQAALPPPLRHLHQAVLRHFLDTGEPPTREWLQSRAGATDDALAALSAADLVHLAGGVVAVAYPFSGVPRGHRVELDGGPAVWAMCAIDALGIPQLAGRDATITAADPADGRAVRVTVRGGEWTWTPPSTVVLMASTRDDGPSASCTCGYVNFYSQAEQARADLDARPDLVGQVLDQPTAVDLADAVFGSLLAGSWPDTA